MCSPNSVFLSVEENQKRSVIEDPEPGNPRKINIQWPHLNGRKQPIEHSEQPFNQVGFMTITWFEQLLLH